MLGAALMKAGLVSESDLERTEKEKREDEKRAQALHEGMIRFDAAMSKLPSHLAKEMAAWMEGNRLIPVTVLENWGCLNKDGVTVEWAKWLHAAQEMNV